VAPPGPLPYAGAAETESAAGSENTGFNAYVLRTSTNPHFITPMARR
jgi:hypothetical protein